MENITEIVNGIPVYEGIIIHERFSFSEYILNKLLLILGLNVMPRIH